MNPEEARAGLDQAQQSVRAATLPPLPIWVPPSAGLLVGGGIAIAGSALPEIWLRVLAVAVGLGLALLARSLVLGVRARQGVRGLRGPGRRTQTSLVVATAAIVVICLAAPLELRWISVGVGVVLAVVVAVMLARSGRS